MPLIILISKSWITDPPGVPKANRQVVPFSEKPKIKLLNLLSLLLAKIIFSLLITVDDKPSTNFTVEAALKFLPLIALFLSVSCEQPIFGIRLIGLKVVSLSPSAVYLITEPIDLLIF